MAANRHAYINFYMSDWLAGTARMTRVQRSIYFDICFYNWDRVEPMPRAEQALQFSDVDGWEAIVKLLLDAGKIKRTKGGGLFSERAMIAARSATERWSNASAAGRQGADKRWKNKEESNGDPMGLAMQNQNQNQNHIIPHSPQGGESDLFEGAPPDGVDPPGEKYPAAFESWWSEYPNKTGKRKASAAYAAAVKRLGRRGEVDFFLLGCLKQQKAIWLRKGVEGRYIPHPATWLNQSRYDDPSNRVWADVTIEKKPAQPEPELSPAAPSKGQGKPKLAPVGWTPGDDDA